MHDADAPAIEYDETTTDALEGGALDRLRHGQTASWRCQSQAEYHSCLRFVTLHDLRYDWNPETGRFLIYPPA